MSRYRGPRVRLQRRLGIRLDDLTKKESEVENDRIVYRANMVIHVDV